MDKKEKFQANEMKLIYNNAHLLEDKRKEIKSLKRNGKSKRNKIKEKFEKSNK